MQTMVALCVVLCAAPDSGRVVLAPTARPPVTAETFRGVWEAVDWNTYRVIRVDTRDQRGYLALMSPYNRNAAMFLVRSVSFPRKGHVLLEAVGITEPSVEIKVSGDGWAFNGGGSIAASITITQRGRTLDQWQSAVLLARQGSALEDAAAVARRAREEIEKAKSKDNQPGPSQGK